MITFMYPECMYLIVSGEDAPIKVLAYATSKVDAKAVFNAYRNVVSGAPPVHVWRVTEMELVK
jgi:hypothetical protein